jgi:predicted ribosomally synthesized peptide with SipW-like signal peptide
MAYHKAPSFTRLTPTSQRGAAAIIGIVIIVILVLAAATFAYFAATQKSGPTLTVEVPKVTADDLLTEGKSNNELVIDRMIVEAGFKRDQEQRTNSQAALDDEKLPVGDGVTASTTVEAARLSQLQTEFITESDRRLKALNQALSLAGDLPTEQKTVSQKYINDEITALTGLKAKSAAETSKEAFLADRDELDKEYTNYLMAIVQLRLLLWANDQMVLEEKINVLGGKFQERLNEASNSGNSIATAQTALNSYQAAKTTAKDTTAKALKAAAEVKPSTFNANEAVIKSYHDQLAAAHTEVGKAVEASKQLIAHIKAYK